MAKVTVTKQREKLTSEIMEKVIKLLEDNEIVYDRTKDFQTLTFECGEIEKDNGEKYPAYCSFKMTMHKEDFSLDDAIYEYEDKIKAKEEKIKIQAEKREKALADKAKREEKRKAEKGE